MLMRGEQVLDLARIGMDAGRDQEIHGAIPSRDDEEVTEVFDPAALGTTLIGLEAIRQQAAADAEGRETPDALVSRASDPQRLHLRGRLARRLRSLADHLEPLPPHQTAR
jgi:hypothetical protein